MLSSQWKSRFFAVAVLAVSASLAAAQDNQRPSRWQPESPPIFRVQEVLDATIIQGPDYFIAQDVPVRGYKYLFTINTPYGELQALGRSMLELRLREMYAIQNARKIAGEPQVFKGIFETFKQTPQGVRTVLTDPGGTILRAPKGFQRMASNAMNPRNFRAGGEDRRRFAVQIGCDPETSNPLLEPVLDNLAFRKSLGKTGSNLGMHVVLPGLGLLSTTKDFQEELVSQSPAEINKDIERELLEMGVWEPVAKQFCRERSYTTLQRMMFMDHLRAISGVENFQYMIYRATNAYNESEGLTMLGELQLMRRLHETQGIRRLDLQGLPVAMLRDSTVVITNASDYIYDTQELRDALAEFRRGRPNDPGVFVTAGKVSIAARKTLSDFDLQVAGSGNTTLVEQASAPPDKRR